MYIISKQRFFPISRQKESLDKQRRSLALLLDVLQLLDSTSRRVCAAIARVYHADAIRKNPYSGGSAILEKRNPQSLQLGWAMSILAVANNKY